LVNEIFWVIGVETCTLLGGKFPDSFAALSSKLEALRRQKAGRYQSAGLPPPGAKIKSLGQKKRLKSPPAKKPRKREREIASEPAETRRKKSVEKSRSKLSAQKQKKAISTKKSK